MESTLSDLIFVFLFCALSGMGIGGGGLFVVYLSVFRSIPQFLCQGINLAVFIFSSAFSGIVNVKKRHINYPLCLFLSVCGCVGAVIGGGFAGMISDNILRLAFGIFLLAVSIISIYINRK